MSIFTTIGLTIGGGIIASILAIVIWEIYKRPVIQLFPNTGIKRAYYHLNIHNIGHSPAYNCKIFMRFYDYSSRKIIINETINGNWDRGPEPVIMVPVPKYITLYRKVHSMLREIQQPFIVPYAEVLDIFHNVTPEGFCPIIKYDNEDECHIFNAESYFHRYLKFPGRQLGKGKYLLEIDLVYAGKKSHKETFVIENVSNKADGIRISYFNGEPSVSVNKITFKNFISKIGTSVALISFAFTFSTFNPLLFIISGIIVIDTLILLFRNILKYWLFKYLIKPAEQFDKSFDSLYLGFGLSMISLSPSLFEFHWVLYASSLLFGVTMMGLGVGENIGFNFSSEVNKNYKSGWIYTSLFFIVGILLLLFNLDLLFENPINYVGIPSTFIILGLFMGFTSFRKMKRQHETEKSNKH